MDRIVSEGDIAKLQQFVGRVVVSRVNLGTLGLVLIVLFNGETEFIDGLRFNLLTEGMEVKFVSHRM